MNSNKYAHYDEDMQAQIEALLNESDKKNYPISTSFSRDILFSLIKYSKEHGHSKIQDVIRVFVSIGLKKQGY